MNEEQLKEIEQHIASVWYYPGNIPEGSKRNAQKDLKDLLAEIRKLKEKADA